MTPPRVLLVTDPAYDDARILSVSARAGEALPRGALGVLLRDHARSRDELRSFARRLRDVTRSRGAWLLVHTDVALASELAAEGVHLAGVSLADGARELARTRLASPDLFLSVAAHTDGDVERAARHGADAVLVSPVFATPGKGTPRGPSAIARARALAPSLAVYALGGVDASNAASCARAGATGVAVVRALLASDDPGAEARALHAALRRDS